MNPTYDNYGRRGITVCERWQKSLEAFAEDMGFPPKPGMCLDRINNDGNYEPGNCRWLELPESSRNSRRPRLVTFNGKTQNLAQWERETGVPYGRIAYRMKRGMSPEQIFSKSKIVNTVKGRKFPQKKANLSAALAKIKELDGL